MIFQGSRYTSASIVPTADAEGVFHPTVVPSLTPPGTARYATYQVTYGDRMDTIAAATLGDSELWWQVAAVNPELIYPDDLQPGSFIRIPLGFTA